MHSPNVVRLVMAESGRGQDVVTPLPGFPEERVALAASPLKNNVATARTSTNICIFNMNTYQPKVAFELKPGVGDY